MSARLRQLITRLTLTAFFGALTLPVVAGVDLSSIDDTACFDARDLGPRHNGVQFATEHAPLESGHCTVCHWMRAVSGATPRPAVTHVVSLTARASQIPLNVFPYAHSASFEQPSRAPPASLPL
jgi:hypothetical protein